VRGRREGGKDGRREARKKRTQQRPGQGLKARPVCILSVCVFDVRGGEGGEGREEGRVGCEAGKSMLAWHTHVQGGQTRRSLQDKREYFETYMLGGNHGGGRALGQLGTQAADRTAGKHLLLGKRFERLCVCGCGGKRQGRSVRRRR